MELSILLLSMVYIIPMIICWIIAYYAIKQKESFYFAWFILVSFVPILNLTMSIFVPLLKLGEKLSK